MSHEDRVFWLIVIIAAIAAAAINIYITTR